MHLLIWVQMISYNVFPLLDQHLEEPIALVRQKSSNCVKLR